MKDFAEEILCGYENQKKFAEDALQMADFKNLTAINFKD